MTKLNNIPKKQAFKVPEDYFETFSERLQERIHPEKPVPFISRVWQILRPQIAMASLMASFLLLAYIGIRIFVPAESTEIQAMQVADLIEEQLYYYDESLIVEAFMGEENAFINEDGSMDPEMVDEIIDYLTNDPNFEILVDDF